MSIKINISGTIFETTITTLKKINYFKYMLEDTNYDNTQIIFVDRPPHIFKHVLAFAIDNNYNYPIKYKGELDFYDMPYDIDKLYNPLDEINNRIHILEKKSDMIPIQCKICTSGAYIGNPFCYHHQIYKNRCIYSKGFRVVCGEKCDNSTNNYYCENHKPKN